MHPIRLRGARTHHLQGIDLDLYPGELTVIAGVSGAGKSSLAFDTLYAEGQRRFIESFSPYARQFLERLERPPVDSLDPVAAGIAVDRRAPVKSSRSTVATMADLEAYLSALFTCEARPLCPDCGELARPIDADSAARELGRAHPDARALVSYPLRADGAEAYLEIREALLGQGYRRLLVAGEVKDLAEVRPSEALAGSAVLVDRVALGDQRRLAAALEEAWRHDREARVEAPAAQLSVALARGLQCPSCARTFRPATSGLFSYQSPVGACPACRGFGRVLGIDMAKVIPDASLSLAGGAVKPWRGKKATWERRMLARFCEAEGIDADAPWRALTGAQQERVLTGAGRRRRSEYPGVHAWFRWLEGRSYKMHVRVLLSRYRSYDPCTTCHGKRLSERSLWYRVDGIDLGEWHRLELGAARSRLEGLALAPGHGELARRELVQRLGYLERVGLGYLTLDRQARTLSGGEAQRVSLTAALGSALSGALFVLDEPTVGLHPTDVPPLAEAMRELAARGNAVVVVEHDRSVIAAADRVVELGPGAGADGGRVTYDGPPPSAAGTTVTPRLEAARPARGVLGVRGARENNLAGIDVDVPLGQVVCVCGPSGSGKSTLVEAVLYRGLARHLGEEVEAPGACDALLGAEQIDLVILADQAPLGRTSRGNAATYSGAWARIRALFAATPEAQLAGLTPASFSFNVAGGRCEACAGEGAETVEMQFLADVRLSCPVCQGKRFRPEVLAVRLERYTIDEVLRMPVARAHAVYEHEGAIARALEPLLALGLGYLPLGQPLSTLSGGESQRLKLARALKDARAGALLICDEPSAGLHPSEIARLMKALSDLADRGASVLVVDHDPAVVAAADVCIELGPGAGAAGGRVVGCAPPGALVGTATARALAHAASPVRAARSVHEPATPAIEVRGAREHNLAGVDVDIRHGELTVVTGPSGSGKSSLAFDVIFAEGQRRFLETLTPYARQFLPVMARPQVDRIAGLPPAVALEQRTARAGAGSTVATLTEVAHYLRLLFAKLGDPWCPDCNVPAERASVASIHARIRRLRGELALLAPVVSARKGSHEKVFAAAERAGIRQALCDGALVETHRPPRLAVRKEHDIALVVYEGRGSALDEARLRAALALGQDRLLLARGGVSAGGEHELLSARASCSGCDRALPELDPRWFSFNTAQGRCAACEGSGLDEAEAPCAACQGTRLAPVPRAVRLQGERYPDLVARSATALLRVATALRFEGDAARLAEAPLAELLRRLAFVVDVGVGYLSLDRRADTLSGGELQRLRLAAQLGSGLTGALYVLDEPTVGLHPRDTGRLLANLRALCKSGSTVLCVEHDLACVRAADQMIDLGPAGGRGGGRVIDAGPPAEVLARGVSPTALALADEGALARPRRAPSGGRLLLRGARAHNLDIDELSVPLGCMVVVAGVSGSGKSTLVRHVLYPAVRRALGLEAPVPGAHQGLSIEGPLDRALSVDQSPIGRTSRSVPATFVGIWDPLRRLFAATPEARARGYGAARFSFNSAAAGGRCESCDGNGVIAHEMAFLPDMKTPCEACGGARFEPGTLEVRYRGLHIGEVLQLTVDEALVAFAAHRTIAAPLTTLRDLGVGYLALGQGSPTLSGGEAQRLKLAKELTAGVQHRPTLYVLDEPTTGLHHSDIRRLVSVLDRLVARGDSLIIIEHHPAVIAAADHVIELGPEGGEAGGRVVAAGTPAAIVRAGTFTGQAIASLLSPPRSRDSAVALA